MVRIPPTTQLARDRIEVGVDESSGTRELWVFDPLLVGPAAHGGPMTLQVSGGGTRRAPSGASTPAKDRPAPKSSGHDESAQEGLGSRRLPPKVAVEQGPDASYPSVAFAWSATRISRVFQSESHS